MMILHHHLQQQPNNIGIDDFLRYYWYVDLNCDVPRLMCVSTLYGAALYSVLSQPASHQGHSLVGVPKNRLTLSNITREEL